MADAGTCAPYATASDPESECRGLAPAGDGGTSSTCVGSCSGGSWCEFPGAERSCAPPACIATATALNFQCNGQGLCVAVPLVCSTQVCAGGNCPINCANSNDCLPSFYCNPSGLTCAPKKPLGQTCLGSGECSSGTCSQGYCCDRVCGGLESCANPGTEGTCNCGGVDCADAGGCTTVHRDQDGDGYGRGGSVGDGGVLAWCQASTPPGGYLFDAGDCDDLDSNARPGQSTFFPDASVSGTFDYNCDGQITHGILTRDAGAVCSSGCTAAPPPGCTGICLLICQPSSACIPNQQSYFTCSGLPVTIPCTGALTSGFYGSGVPCGSVGNLVQCGLCPSDGGSAFTTVPTVQTCR